jgi:hypothetical protein
MTDRTSNRSREWGDYANDTTNSNAPYIADDTRGCCAANGETLVAGACAGGAMLNYNNNVCEDSVHSKSERSSTLKRKTERRIKSVGSNVHHAGATLHESLSLPSWKMPGHAHSNSNSADKHIHKLVGGRMSKTNKDSTDIRSTSAPITWRASLLPTILGAGAAVPYPVQARCYEAPSMLPHLQTYGQDPVVLETIGDPGLKIFLMKLPWCFIPMLDQIKYDCEVHASTLANGWRTELYSLTKQDVSLRSIPATFQLVQPLIYYLKRCLAFVASREFASPEHMHMDRNQPHVLKYSVMEQQSLHSDSGRHPTIAKDEKKSHSKSVQPPTRTLPNRDHTGVQLHHDKCDFTINLMLSQSASYEGGGTYFSAAKKIVRLNYGEFLIHPGGAVHSGVDITRGSRYLFIMFADAIKATKNQC